MSGRIENQQIMESKIINRISQYPDFIQGYYFSLNSKSYMTKNTYMNVVERFIKYIGKGDINSVSIADLKNINGITVLKYFENIKYYNESGEKKHMTNTSKARIYSSLNSFFKYLVSYDYMETNPIEKSKIECPKPEKTEITFLTPEEVKSIENNIINGVGTHRMIMRQHHYKYRDMLLFHLPVINGIRVKALSEIDVSDINLNERSISVIEKGNIKKKVYFDKKAKEAIINWLEERAIILGETQCDALFISQEKKRITPMAINNIIKKYCESVTNKHITAHKLRSTCGTNLYQNTKDIYLVADVLGHTSTSPTKRYAKVFDTDKKNAANKLGNLYS